MPATAELLMELWCSDEDMSSACDTRLVWPLQAFLVGFLMHAGWVTTVCNLAVVTMPLAFYPKQHFISYRRPQTVIFMKQSLGDNLLSWKVGRVKEANVTSIWTHEKQLLHLDWIYAIHSSVFFKFRLKGFSKHHAGSLDFLGSSTYKPILLASKHWCQYFPANI